MKEKLLVLDDEPRILASLENLLEDDYEVLTASDADTALELARRRDIAVVLSDERMPGLSRHEFLRRLKDVSNSTRVLLSGSGGRLYADCRCLSVVGSTLQRNRAPRAYASRHVALALTDRKTLRRTSA